MLSLESARVYDIVRKRYVEEEEEDAEKSVEKLHAAFMLPEKALSLMRF